MNLATNIKNYLLEKLLERIAKNQLTASEKEELETVFGIDEHARHYIMLTNGNVKAFMQMYGTLEDELLEIDKICSKIERKC